MQSSIDKFGGYLGYKSTGKIIPGPPGKGFKLTSNNDYDIENKRLTNIGQSIESNDAVSLNYILTNCPIFEEKQVNYKKRKLTNVDDPESKTDVVTKGYFESALKKDLSLCVKFNSNRKFIDCKQSIIKNLSDPIDDKDAISLEYFKNNSLHIENGNFNARQIKITNIKDPEQSSDVTSKGYIETYVTRQIHEKCVTFGVSNVVDFKNYTLKNCLITKVPTVDFDVVNKIYVDGQLLKLDQSTNTKIKDFIKPENNEVNFKTNKVFINEAIHEKSPVNLKQLNHILQKYIFMSKNNQIDVHDLNVINVKQPTNKHDAANKEYVDNAVRSNNKTFIDVVVNEEIKDFIKPNKNGVIDFQTGDIKLVLKVSDDENAPLLNKQFNAFKKRIESDISRIDTKVNEYYPSVSTSARSANEENGKVDMSKILKDISDLKSIIANLKPDNDDEKNDFWERVDKLNSK